MNRFRTRTHACGCFQRNTGAKQRLARMKCLAAATDAAEREARSENVEGQFYVDHTCIDCDTCRWMAPHTFGRVNLQSAVTQQPQDRAERIEAMQAVMSCPTFSIHMRHNDSDELQDAQAGMPIPVPECPGIFHCGFHSVDSAGAASYILQRQSGNIMMDCPRFNPKLAKNIAAMGGISQIVLSHIDDICDHAKWAKHFGVPRLMHKTEVTPDIDDIEIQIEGGGPWNLKGEVIGEDELDDDLQLVHTPGHTQGCICVWDAPTKTLFTGDHFGANGWHETRPTIFPFVNRYGTELQIQSVEKLMKFDWLHILPGHGRRLHVSSAEERQQALNAAKPDAGLVPDESPVSGPGDRMSLVG